MSTPEPKTAVKTTYHVFREVIRDADTVSSYVPLQANVEAASGAAAIRKTVTETGTYVAIPSRSFVPTKVTLSQQTVVTLG